MGLAGFDFQQLNKNFLFSTSQPVNQAASYGASVIPVPSGRAAWRCIGIYHLAPNENSRRHNVYIDVLDETGQRDSAPAIEWTYRIDGPAQFRRLDKPADEPACDIPINPQDTITIRVASGDSLPSDSVGNLHARHMSEGNQNTWGHHSFYVVFQRQGVVTPPVVVEPQPDEVARLRQENAALRSMIASAIGVLEDAL